MADRGVPSRIEACPDNVQRVWGWGELRVPLLFSRSAEVEVPVRVGTGGRQGGKIRQPIMHCEAENIPFNAYLSNVCFNNSHPSSG